MSDVTASSAPGGVSQDSSTASASQAQAFTAQIQANQESAKQGSDALSQEPALLTQPANKKKSPIKKIIKKTQRQQAKHYVLMNFVQNTDLEAAYQALARKVGSAAALKHDGKPE
jgi:hypothetical protein